VLPFGLTQPKNSHVFPNNFHVSTCFHSRDKNLETLDLERTTYSPKSLLAGVTDEFELIHDTSRQRLG
jgi:hypothetical protein